MTEHATLTDLLDRAYAELVHLGDTEDEIAAALRARGIKGRRKEACTCPIANFLVAVFGEECHPEVDDDITFLGWNPKERLAVPAAVLDFIEAFDLGSYPQLIEEASA